MLYPALFRVVSLLLGVVAIIGALLYSLGQNEWQTPPVIALSVTLFIAVWYTMEIMGYTGPAKFIGPLVVTSATIASEIFLYDVATTAGMWTFALALAAAGVLAFFQAFTGKKDLVRT